jgi:hypothetical protein
MATPQQIIYDTAIKAGLSDTTAKLLVGQSAHETGNWTSNAYKKHFNGFGYTYYSGSKWQTGSRGLIADNKQPVADYKNLSDSTNEVIDWLKRRQAQGKFKISDLNTPEKYAKALEDNNYYTDNYSIYVKGLVIGMKKWAGNLTTKTKVGIGSVLVLGIIFYLGYRYFKNK